LVTRNTTKENSSSDYILKETDSSEEIIEDYSDFGFVNMHNSHYFVCLNDQNNSFYEDDSWSAAEERLNFDDLNNAYIYTYSSTDVLYIYGGTITHMDETNSFTETSVAGNTVEAANYSAAGNNVLTLTSGYYSGSTLTIKKREFKYKVPFLYFDSKSTSRHCVLTTGWHIPSEVIDWSRSPELNTDEFISIDGPVTIESQRYYIKKELLK